jgi:hypothetical protein
MIRVPIPLIAAALALAAVGATAAATEPSGTPSNSLPVVAGGGSGGAVRASVVCPNLKIVPGTLVTTVAVGTANPGAGSVRLTSAAGTKRDAVSLLGNGKQRELYSGPITGPLELQATGPLANSLVAEQAARANKTGDRGWSEARCEPPRAEQWFVGSATTPGNTPTLELANPTDTNAVTDVTVFTPDGISATNAGHNLSLAPHSVLNLDLTKLAPNATTTAVRVSTTNGRVSAAILDVRTSGLNLTGTDWVPVASTGVSQVITGIPGPVAGATPKATLAIADPGDSDATVSVKLIGPTGTFVPVGMDAIAVTANTVKTVDLTAALAASAGGVIVTSDDPAVPIVSSVLVDVPSSKGTPIHEITYLGPDTALSGAALAPLVYTGGGFDIDSVLVLSAPDDPVSITLVLTNAAGVTQRTRIAVQPGTTRAVSLRAVGAGDNTTATLIPDDGSPPLYAVRLITENGAFGPLISSFALSGAPAEQHIPPVVAEPLAGN